MVVFALIPLVVVLACVVGLIWLWVAALRRPAGGPMPACGRCGYAVVGLTGLNCPECGADLREVGITTPRSRQRVGPLTFVMFWTLLLPVPAIVISLNAVSFGPHANEYTRWIDLQVSHAHGMSVLLEFGQRIVHWRSGEGIHHRGMRGYYRPRAPYPVTATLFVPAVAPGASQASLSVTYEPRQQAGNSMQLDLLRGTGRYRDASRIITVSFPPTEDQLFDWYKTQQTQVSDDELRTYAADLAQIMEAIRNGSGTTTSAHYRFAGGGSSWGTGPVAWFSIMVALCWLAVYAGGIVLYFRVRRKRIAAAAIPGYDQPASPPQEAAT